MTAVDPLLSTEGRNWLLNFFFETPPDEIEKRCNIQLLNLLCASGLPGNENLDIRACLVRLDQLTEYIRGSIDRTFRAYGVSAQYSYCKFQTWMGCLVTRMKQEFGACYSPQAKADLHAGIEAPFSDASEVFISGLLREDRSRRWGTCASIPVLVTSIARKLGYPVRLAHARQHRYCRWEGQGRCFNIEASNPMGMAVEPDEHYQKWRGGLPPEVLKSGYYFRSVTPAEEFAGFMLDRISVLRDAGRYDEILQWSARAMQFAPDNVIYPPHAYHLTDLLLKQRFRIEHPNSKVESGDSFHYEIGDLIKPHERPWVMTIVGHYREYNNELNAARREYEDACRQNFEGNNEQRDLQRFLKKHDMPRRKGPLLPPNNLGQHRRFQLKCRPEKEAELLRRMADEFEQHEQPLKARDALHDLYMFDPSDAGIFQRARALEQLPQFQSQLKSLVGQRRRELQNAGCLPWKFQSLPMASDDAHSNAFDIEGPLKIVNPTSGKFTVN